jgi:hypothetical protein
VSLISHGIIINFWKTFCMAIIFITKMQISKENCLSNTVWCIFIYIYNTLAYELKNRFSKSTDKYDDFTKNWQDLSRDRQTAKEFRPLLPLSKLYEIESVFKGRLSTRETIDNSERWKHFVCQRFENISRLSKVSLQRLTERNKLMKL